MATLSPMYRTMERSCEMTKKVSPSCACRSLSRLTICARIDTSRGRYRFVEHQHLWREAQCAGDCNPLALTAAELVRVSLGMDGRQRHLLQQRRHFGSSTSCLESRSLITSGSAMMRPDAQLRVERAPWVIGTPPGCSAGTRVSPPGTDHRSRRPADRSDPSVGRSSLRRRFAQRRLAAAGLARQAEGLALTDREVDAVHGLHRLFAVGQDAPADVEMLLDVPAPRQAVDGAWMSAGSAASWTCWVTPRAPRPANTLRALLSYREVLRGIPARNGRRRRGTSARSGNPAALQRGDGGWPSIEGSRSGFSSMLATDFNSASE